MVQAVSGSITPSFDDAESVEVNTQAAAVWAAVGQMRPIPDASAAPFRFDLSYPVRSEICGESGGAIQRRALSFSMTYERVTE